MVASTATTRTRIVRIGNSQGIRIPKPILEQLGLSGEVELEIQADQLIIRSVQAPRHSWADQFQQMAEFEDDTLLDETSLSLSDWDEDEWTW
ncbi:MAG: AbrB/MazE/SpoVT family DNA-binding domain-containing protein [Cyanobacteria bacterium Co-bin8]|nr:AbrB/MazE/SpoVT family DNA-binding domain-containing protein [Cyanobacteria bacterium Co-bin8]